jgi:hypothetical protein
MIVKKKTLKEKEQLLRDTIEIEKYKQELKEIRKT